MISCVSLCEVGWLPGTNKSSSTAVGMLLSMAVRRRLLFFVCDLRSARSVGGAGSL